MKHLYLSVLALFISFASFAIGPITGNTNICAGGVTTLSNATPGGTWSNSNTLVASVGLTNGVVAGASAGTTVITYNTSGGSATVTVTVNLLPSAITGPTSVCSGSTIVLSNAVPGGIWRCSSPPVA